MLETEQHKKKKRRVGRPKKRGPKKKRKYVSKKPKIDGRHKPSPQLMRDYKIVACHNGKQSRFVGVYKEIHEAYNVFNELKSNNKTIIFPALVQVNETIVDIVDEYLLLEKDRLKTKTSNKLPNKYGVLVEQQLNTDKWVLIDKFTYYKEETFWVWGYDPKAERMTFMEIYNNVIMSDISSKYDMKRVILYKNKIVIKDDNNEYDIVFCKTEGDAVRFYNKLNEIKLSTKNKNIVLLGSYSEISDKRRNLEKDLCEVTGFSKAKIQMSLTKFRRKH